MSLPAHGVPSVDLRRAVVLAGAGISIEGPSALPSGDELALILFDFVTGGRSYPFSAAVVAELRREIRVGALRLEVMCDLLSADLPAVDVMSIFRLLECAIPNRLHLALALLKPSALLTPNQDLLLEDAAALVGSPLRPLHLHGRCDRPSSILATAKEYLHGLSPAKAQLFRRVVRGRDFVVIGYSGRDRDIMDTLTESEPRRVIWIEHGRRSAAEELPPELLAAERNFGSSWTRVSASTSEWVFSQLRASERRRVCAELAKLALITPPSRASGMARVGARLAKTDRAARAIAVGRVLRHAGHPDEARLGYQRLRRKTDDARVALAWAEATFETDQFETVLPVFRQVAANGAPPTLRARALVGEVETLRNMSRYPEARLALRKLKVLSAKIADPVQRAHALAAAACQQAGLERMDGVLRRAEADYAEAEGHALLAGDVRNALEARTWRAEIALARGHYAEALAASTATLKYAPLTTMRWLTWAKFVHGEALAANGRLAEGLAMLNEVLAEFEDYGNGMGEVWTFIAEAVLLRPEDHLGARYALEAASDAIDHYKGPLVYARTRLALERAELARAVGDYRAAARELSRYRASVSRRIGKRHVWLDAHGEALAAELLRDRGLKTAAAVRARQVKAAYRRLGAEGAVRRMTLSAWASASPPPTTARVLEDWQTKGYALELYAWSSFTRSGYLPLQHWFVP
jgi:tetratricopeptide (TPR) repeat protein